MMYVVCDVVDGADLDFHLKEWVREDFLRSSG
jgi:hypothetical protein